MDMLGRARSAIEEGEEVDNRLEKVAVLRTFL